jgi:hypothetical protein
LHEPFEDLRAGSLGECLELLQGRLRVSERAGRPDADQDDPLEAKLAVLDLADVLELGRDARDASQTAARLQLQLDALVPRIDVLRTDVIRGVVTPGK